MMQDPDNPLIVTDEAEAQLVGMNPAPTNPAAFRLDLDSRNCFSRRRLIVGCRNTSRSCEPCIWSRRRNGIS